MTPVQVRDCFVATETSFGETLTVLDYKNYLAHIPEISIILILTHIQSQKFIQTLCSKIETLSCLQVESSCRFLSRSAFFNKGSIGL